MLVLDTVPREAVMKRLSEKMEYSFQETPGGGRVVIYAADEEPLAAIHKFLLFQIEDHRTGDPTPVH